MTAKILCPIDGTDHSATGLAQAIELAKLKKAHLTICIVNLAEGGARGGPTIPHWNEADAGNLLTRAEAAARDAGVTDVGTSELVSREAASAIVTYAAQQDVTLIVMGTGDKRGVKRLVLGSVAAEVAGHAHCSVLVAR